MSALIIAFVAWVAWRAWAQAAARSRPQEPAQVHVPLGPPGPWNLRGSASPVVAHQERPYYRASTDAVAGPLSASRGLDAGTRSHLGEATAGPMPDYFDLGKTPIIDRLRQLSTEAN